MSVSDIICNSCSNVSKTAVYPIIKADSQPELKEKLLSGELFLWECPHCHSRQLLKYPLVYVDAGQQLIICLSSVPLAIDGLEGNTGRLVGEPGELIEKIKIFDSGLDDIAVEICKFITAREAGKDMKLKFLRFEGADNELVFTYPESGEMQLLAVGLNVYEDCKAIIDRNPSIRNLAAGMAKVDGDFISGILG